MSDDRRLDGLTLDGSLAIELFGWTRHDMHMVYEGKHLYRWEDADGRERPGLHPWSETWAGLGLVVEAMRGKGWTCELYCYPPRQPVKVKLYPSQPDPLPPYMAVCALDREPWARADAHADTAPRAVALAAYQALTGRKWEG
jgi:hypothetical protein